MINQVSVINARGESYTFSLKDPSASGFFIESIEGLYPPQAEVNQVTLAGKDGSYVNNVRTQSRNITFSLGVMSGAYIGVEELRHKLYRIFPIKGSVQLRFYNDLGERLDISGYVESSEVSIWTKKQVAVVSIICPEPYFSNGNLPSGYLSSFVGPTTAGFEFPFSDEPTPALEFSTVNYAEKRHVLNDPGDLGHGAIFMAYCGVNTTGLYIERTNSTYKQIYEQMYFSNLTALIGTSILLAGDLVTISTVKGDKYVTITRNGVDYNALGYLVDGATFKWISLPAGESYVRFRTITIGESDLSTWVFWQPVYQGG